MAKKHILVVEDEDDIRELVRFNLESNGYQVEAVATGEEAMASVHATPPDLVVLDLRMPLLNGAEAFLEMRRIDPGVRAVIISGNAQIEDLRELSQRGLVGSLRKPFVERELLEFISGAMHG